MRPIEERYEDAVDRNDLLEKYVEELAESIIAGEPDVELAKKYLSRLVRVTGATGKRANIELKNLKSSDGWGELGTRLGFSHAKINKTFEYGEYGHIKIVVDEDLNIVGGQVIPCGK